MRSPIDAAGWFLLACLASGFVVFAEPAPTDIAFVMALGLVLLGTRIHLPQAIHSYAILSFVYLLANTSSAMFCTQMTFCFRYMGITIYLLLIPPVMVHLMAANGPRYLDLMYRAFFLAIFISAALGLLARFGFLPGPKTLYFRADDGLRLSPLFKDPNVYAPFLAAGLMLFFGHLVARTGRFWIGVVGLMVIWMPLLLAFSRAAWLSLAFSAVAFVITMQILGFGRRVNRKLIWMLLVASLIILPMTAALLFTTGLSDFFEQRLGLQRYDSDRFQAQAEAVRVATENPFGIGPGHYVGKTNFPESRFELAPHNVYAKVWVENGFLGILIFLAILLWAMIDLLRVARLRTNRLPIHIALFSALLGILVNGIFIDTLHWRHLFVVLGFAYCEIYLVERAYPGQRDRSFSTRGRGNSPVGAGTTARPVGSALRATAFRRAPRHPS